MCVLCGLESRVQKTGVWCDRCSTSAAIVVVFFKLGDDGVTPVTCRTYCSRCDLKPYLGLPA